MTLIFPFSICARKSTALCTHAEHVRDPTTSDDNEKNGKNHQSYNWPPEQDAMVLAHNAIRKEVQDMKCALETIMEHNDKADGLETWQIDAILTWWKGHEAHVRFHCQNENVHLHPLLSERLEGFPVEQLQNEHVEIHTCLEKLSGLMSKLSSSDEEGGLLLQPLWEQWFLYTESVLYHFQQEEEISVASTRRAFGAKEWAPIIKVFFYLGAKEEFGSFIHCMGEEEFRQTFMRQRKIPGFVWRLAFKKNLEYYETSMWQHMKALLRGTPPNA